MKVSDVKYLKDYIISITFEDGIVGTIDLSDLVKQGIFSVFRAAARENRLESFFENFFDEKIHQGEENPKNVFLQKVRKFSEMVFNDYPDDQTCRDIIFTILRFIHFINSTREWCDAWWSHGGGKGCSSSPSPSCVTGGTRRRMRRRRMWRRSG